MTRIIFGVIVNESVNGEMMVEKNITHLRVSKSFKDRVDRMRGNLSTAKFLDMVEMLVGDQKQIREKKRDAAFYEQLYEIRQRLEDIEDTMRLGANTQLSPVWCEAVREVMAARRMGDSSMLSAISRMLIDGAERNWQRLGYDEHYGSVLDSKLDTVFEKLVELTAATLEYNTSLSRQAVNQEQSEEIYIGNDQ